MKAGKIIKYFSLKGHSLHVPVMVLLFLASCSHKQPADLIVHNAVIYTVDSSFSSAQSFAVKDGKFIAAGSDSTILATYESSNVIDAGGKPVYPGFIDSHCHFYGYGKGLGELDLVGTRSFEEVINRLKNYAATKKEGDWIIGRGWDQNDWDVKEFPDKAKIDALFPRTPVFLERVDGHAALVNTEAFRQAHFMITENPVKGGIIEMKNGQLTGILIDNAVDLIKKEIPPPSRDQMKESLLRAQEKCFAVGLTTVDDAGLDMDVILAIQLLEASQKLKMRIYAMLSDTYDNALYFANKGPEKTDHLNIRSFKFYADGALGSRGAALLKPYSDKPMQTGLLLNTPAHFDSAAAALKKKGFQMNTHCIGDSAVRLLLGTYSHYMNNHCLSAQSFPKNKADRTLRWRIEHFQVSTHRDIQLLKCLNLPSGEPNAPELIPSVQPTHATSDMYWAKDRLGAERINYAYAYNDLLKACGMIALGTDFPVENINPMYTFYAAVARKDLKGFPEGGFQMENALSRENTLRGMTIWGAYANFEEKEKGSIEAGKFADFVILDTDIMKCDIDKVPTAKVRYTFVGGECVFSN